MNRVGVDRGKEKEKPMKLSKGGSARYRAAVERWTSGRGDKCRGGGARKVQRGDRRWSRLAGSLVDPAASSVRRDVTMAVVVIAERCVAVIS